MGEPKMVKLTGHLTPDSLREALAPVRSPSGECCVIIDALGMSGYELSAREVFIEWNKATRNVVRRVAIVTDNALWQTVIAAIGLASRQQIRSFKTMEAAFSWIGGDAR